MATTAITNGIVYITNGSVSGSNIVTSGSQTLVEIHATKVDHNLDNPISVLNIPVVTGNIGSKTPFSKLIELKKITESLQIAGDLDDEPTESANIKKNNLINYVKNNRSLTVVWNTGSYQTVWRPSDTEGGAQITKIMFSETAGIKGENVTADPQPERQISVQIQLVRGKDI